MKRSNTGTWHRRRFLVSAAAIAGAGQFSFQAHAKPDAPPKAKRVSAVDDYYGTKVADPYQWMENIKDPDLLPWLKGQDAHTRAMLGRVPARNALRARVSALSADLSSTRSVAFAGDRLFYEQLPAGEQNYKLFVREANGSSRLLIDPTRLQDQGRHVSLDWWRASPDGRHVAYGLSPAGSEASTAHILEVSSGRILEERIANTDWGITGWLSDGSGFFYLQFTGERGTPSFYHDSVVKLHQLGTDAVKDPVVMRRDLYAQVPMTKVQVAIVMPIHGTGQAIVMVRDIRPERAIWTVELNELMASKPRFRPVATVEDLVVGMAVTGDDLFLLSNRDRPRGRLLLTSVRQPALATAAEVMPQSAFVAEAIFPLRGGVLVRTMDGGVQRLARVSRSGQVTSLQLPFDGAVDGVFASDQHEDAYFTLTGWLQPRAVWRMSADLSVSDTGLDAKPPYDLSAYVAERRSVKARDGTQVPYTIVARRGWQANGRNAVLATAYGAYQLSWTPSFQPRLLAFLDAGGIYVVANVRGGGEYGREWHKAGQKATKPNTWRDFIDVSQALIGTRVTSPRQLVIQGTSAGGIAVGRALTERPELFAGAIADVGFMNPLRYASEQNNLDVDEWGPMVDAETFRVLYQMDSYHAVKAGVRYPPVLVVSGYNDPRVATFHAGKFTAALQAASGNRSPALLRVDFGSGHGVGSTREQRDALVADMYAFTLWCAGAAEFQPRVPAAQ